MLGSDRRARPMRTLLRRESRRKIVTFPLAIRLHLGKLMSSRFWSGAPSSFRDVTAADARCRPTFRPAHRRPLARDMRAGRAGAAPLAGRRLRVRTTSRSTARARASHLRPRPVLPSRRSPRPRRLRPCFGRRTGRSVTCSGARPGPLSGLPATGARADRRPRRPADDRGGRRAARVPASPDAAAALDRGRGPLPRSALLRRGRLIAAEPSCASLR